MRQLLSVGLDVGTTSTQMIVSRLQVENRASSFSVPRLEIGSREILYKSPVHFTPLEGIDRIDGEKLKALVEQEYAAAGITPEQVDTGAVIITGETSRRENADTVLRELSHIAGDFVVATAGPDLESVLAAKGAGAVDYSAKTGKTVLHFDIGGGTANMALIAQGKILETGCLNVGGRLIKLGESGEITYLSPVLLPLTDLKVGEIPALSQLEAVCDTLTQALEMAAGLRERTNLLEKLTTNHVVAPPKNAVMSFSGGVADCIENLQEPGKFGDIGTILGKRIRESRLCSGQYRLGTETIRATVIGAGCYSTQLSGSTVYCRGVELPLQNLPVAVFSEEEQHLPAPVLQDLIERRTEPFEDVPVLFFPGVKTYGQLRNLSDAIAGTDLSRFLVASGRDMAKALGQALSLQTERSCLCLDGVALREGDFLDVGRMAELCFPVVVKTLIFSE